MNNAFGFRSRRARLVRQVLSVCPGSVPTFRAALNPLVVSGGMFDTVDVGKGPDRNLEFDLQALSARLRADDAFATEMYCALCNVDWRHIDGTTWHGSWRYSAGLVATLRGRGEDYLDYYCSGIPTRSEGTISERIAAAMAELGWTGTAHGSDELYTYDFQNGRTEALGDDRRRSPGAERFTDAVRGDHDLRAELDSLATPETEPLDHEDWRPD